MPNPLIVEPESDDSDDDAPPIVISSKKAVKKQEPTRQSVIEAQKAAKKKQQTTVTAGLRGDDYLPPEILSHLPSGSAQPSGASSSAADEAAGGKRLTKAEAKAAARRAEAEELAKRRQTHEEAGLPRVVPKGQTVEVAVLPPDEGGVGGAKATRMHAPIKQDARAFLQQQLYGQRHTRVSAATLASQRPSGGRFGAASNFATVPLDQAKPTGVAKKGKRKGGKDKPVVAGHSTLEQMAAAIMRKKR